MKQEIYTRFFKKYDLKNLTPEMIKQFESDPEYQKKSKEFSKSLPQWTQLYWIAQECQLYLLPAGYSKQLRVNNHFELKVLFEGELLLLNSEVFSLVSFYKEELKGILTVEIIRLPMLVNAFAIIPNKDVESVQQFLNEAFQCKNQIKLTADF